MKNRHILEKLMTLKQEESKHSAFNFCTFKKELECGTAGCLAGNLPFIVPEEWEFYFDNTIDNDGYYIKLVKNSTSDETKDLVKYFDLSRDEIDHLFFPYCQEPYKYGGHNLNSEATLEEVQNNIREFLRIYDEQEAQREADTELSFLD